MEYVFLAIAAFLPCVAAVLLKLFDISDKGKKMPYIAKQAIYGVIFGALAIVGTEWGIKINGAVVNARDAAVVTAGLVFGGPAGIIAGAIGGIERYFAVYWGVGKFTQIACSISTFVAGVAAGAARKYMFDGKRPTWELAALTAFVVEVFHLAMVFFTNINQPIDALRVVKACAGPMLIANTLSVLVTNVVLSSIKYKWIESKDKGPLPLSRSISSRLMALVIVGVLFSSTVTYFLQQNIASTQRDQLLNLAIEETQADIRDASNENMLSILREIKVEAEKFDADDLDVNFFMNKFNLAEVNIVNDRGFIIKSSSADYVGFDMSSGEQSSAFLVLLGDVEEYVQDYMPTSYDPNVYRKYAGVKISIGFIQVGYNYDQFQENVTKQLNGITVNRHVGRGGYVFIVSQENKIVSSPREIEISHLQEAFEAQQNPRPNYTFEAPLNGETYFVRFDKSEGYIVISFIPVNEILQTRDITLLVAAFNEVIIFAAFYVMIFLLIKLRVVRNVDKVNESLHQITSGNLDEKVNVKTNKEFVWLSNSINSTVDTLKDYIEAANTKMDEELQLAKNIQTSALPKPYPMFSKHKEFDIAAYMGTAKEVGGDFYDFYLNENKLNFLIADVSGKGVPAAMFMMRAKTELKSLSESDMYISDVFTLANAELCSGNEAGMFVTAWQAKLDLKTGLIWYVNAGHNAPLIKRRDGKFEYIKARANLVLAGMDGFPYRAEQLQLEAGDILFLYTDGVTEATNANNELYSEQRLLDVLNSKEFLSTEEICDYVKESIDEFVGDAPQFDDITMVCFKYNGENTTPKLYFEAATINNIEQVTEFVERELEKVECPLKVVMQINVAIDELFSNIVRYGYGNHQQGPVTLYVDVNSDDRVINITFEDSGIAYNPLEKEDPDVTLSAEDRQIGGLGIYMVKQTMDDIKYERHHQMNVLTITKKY